VERNNFFDSLKFILIFLVVLGHVMEYEIYENHLRLTVFSFIYTFHMPLFIFISGYFSKNLTWEKYKKSFASLALTYVVFQIYYLILSHMSGSPFDLKEAILVPKNVLWYILGLLFWRFFFCFIPKLKIPFPLLLIISILISIASCFYNSSNVLLKFIHFFPFFIAGYYCSSNIIEKIRSWNKLYILGISALIFCGLFIFADKWLLFTIFGDFPYSYYPEGYNGIALKLLTYVLGAVMSVCVINLASERFYKQGTKTMAIYLLHSTYVYFYRMVGEFEVQPWFILMDFVGAAAIVAVCLLLYRIKIIQYCTNPIEIVRLIKNKI
jgi:fucose 4-O-acetylase-like acetyltransferase